jgi:hypothetical protein
MQQIFIEKVPGFVPSPGRAGNSQMSGQSGWHAAIAVTIQKNPPRISPLDTDYPEIPET